MITETMIGKHIAEAALGTTSLTLYGFGLVAQAAFPTDITTGIVAMVTQFGGLGVAVWLVYYHTTSTIPTMQKEYREERESIAVVHLEQLAALAASHKAVVTEQRQDFVEALKHANCKFGSERNHE